MELGNSHYEVSGHLCKACVHKHVLKLISASVNKGRTSLPGSLGMIFKCVARSTETNQLITCSLVKTNAVNTSFS